ncbi:MAG: type III pantothenate kinase [Pseudomonadota bacterium]|nr:type III pantothenate kinase [Pseudomonadota bacterium]
MNRLLLDLGNSRLKWRFCEQRSAGPMRAQAWPADARIELPIAVAPHVAVGVSVAGRAARTTLERLLRSTFPELPAPHWLRPSEHWGTLRCGYHEPALLGPDRWAALVGAHALLARGPYAVLSIGTAITLDLVDATGRHISGGIAPGRRLLRLALREATGGIGAAEDHACRRRAAGPVDTAAAVAAGVDAALHGTCARFAQIASHRLGPEAPLLVTGGGAAAWAPLLGGRAIDDLVLQGVARLHDGQP